MRAASIAFSAARMAVEGRDEDRRGLFLFGLQIRNLKPTSVREVAEAHAEVYAEHQPFLADLWLAYADLIEAVLLRPRLELVR